jgi:hypothetical protein
MAVKFEELFKHCDESNVNFSGAGMTRSQKSLYSTWTFAISRNSIYRRPWQTGNHRHSRCRPRHNEQRRECHDEDSAPAATQLKMQ